MGNRLEILGVVAILSFVSGYAFKNKLDIAEADKDVKAYQMTLAEVNKLAYRRAEVKTEYRDRYIVKVKKELENVQENSFQCPAAISTIVRMRNESIEQTNKLLNDTREP